MTEFSELQILSLRENELKSLPEDISGLSELQELYLWGNELKALPDTITCLSKIRTLELENNHLYEFSAQIQSWINCMIKQQVSVHL